MSNYNQSEVSGTKWTRCNKITIANPFKEAGYAIFTEEEVIAYEADDGTTEYIKVPSLNTCSLSFSEEGLITRYDPATGEPTSEVLSHKELYEVIYSMYRNAAQLRDLGFVQPPLVI